MVAEAVYLLCALASGGCAALQLRGFFRSRTTLLLWSSLAFLGLALSNALLFLDLVVLPGTDLFLARNLVGAASGLLLLYGLIWEVEW